MGAQKNRLSEMVPLLHSMSMSVYILNVLFNKQKTKVADKSSIQTHRLVYAFVVRKATKSGFFATRPINYGRFSTVFKAIQLQFPIITKDSEAAWNTKRILHKCSCFIEFCKRVGEKR